MSQPKSFPWGLLVVLILLGGGGYGAYYWYRTRDKESAPELRTEAVARGNIVQSITANGQLGAIKSVTVGSQVSGIITDIRVDFNSRVTNGQIVAQIDPQIYQQNITQSEAERDNARAALELAEVNHRRNSLLRTNGLIAPSELDKSLAELHQAEAVVKMREASLRRSRVDFERTTIYAPIDGIVISRAVDVGQTVAANFNAPTLFSIANDLRNMRIEAMVSEADVGGITEGQRVNFSVEAFPTRQFRGEVTQVRYAPITNQNVVNYTAVVEVDNADLKLRPGMTANATIVTAETNDVLRVANSAFRFRPPEEVILTGATNAPGGGRGGRGGGTGRSGEGSGTGGGGGEGRSRMADLSPEQREAARARMRARNGEGATKGEEVGISRPIYLLEAVKSTDPAAKGKPILRKVMIKTGISDGTYSEVLDGLKEGDQVLIGYVQTTPATSAARPGSPPFGGSPFGGGGGFRPR
jgi:HlyD family secretion protein